MTSTAGIRTADFHANPAVFAEKSVKMSKCIKIAFLCVVTLSNIQLGKSDCDGE
jgi:hypothetical protein